MSQTGVLWPNASWWSALEDGRVVSQQYAFDEPVIPVRLRVVDCGTLMLPHGRLIACDPFVSLKPTGNRYVSVPPGNYPVLVTIADVSGQDDRSEEVHAYMTVIIGDAVEVERRMCQPLADHEAPSFIPLEPGQIWGFGVDSATACFVDDGCIASGIPKTKDFPSHQVLEVWGESVNPAYPMGRGNVALPLSTDGANIVLVTSGWGDGLYPVIGGYDEHGAIVRVHVDFGVISDPDKDPRE